MKKECYKCHCVLETTKWFYRSSHTSDGFQGLCKPCNKKVKAEWYATHKEQVYKSRQIWETANSKRLKAAKKKYAKEHSERLRILRWKRLYNLTPEQHERLWIEQDEKCAICKTPFYLPAKYSYPIDHDHRTGNVRGILCSRCNKALGGFRDNPEFLQNAIAYLTPSPRTESVI